jgi:hypothetical protein
MVARHAVARRPWYCSPWFMVLVFGFGVVIGWWLVPHSPEVVNHVHVVYRTVMVPRGVVPRVSAPVHAGVVHAAHLTHVAHLGYLHARHLLHEQHVRYLLGKNTLW